MNNNKNILKILTIAMATSNMVVGENIYSLAYNSKYVDNYNITEKPNHNGLNIFNNYKIFSKRIITSNNSSVNNSKTIIQGKTLDVVLNEGDFIENIENNTDGYEIIKVRTNGNKKLVKEDYDNLRNSGIPKIDLSESNSDFIPAGAFTNATHIIEFRFPKGITSIGGTDYTDGAFYGCSSLSGDLIIPTTVATIGNYAFFECSNLNGNLVIPNSVTKIGDYAFARCNGFIGELNIPEYVTYIGAASFYECYGFTGSLIIPDSVTEIGPSAFALCDGFNGNLKISNSLSILNDNTFAFCSNFTGDLVIPNSVKTIDDFVFFECSGFNGSLTISNSAKNIGTASFYNCSGFMGGLSIPDSVVVIKDFSFEGCSNFNGHLTLGKKVNRIGKQAFKDCSGFTGSLILPESLVYLESFAFYNCSGFTGDLTIPKLLDDLSDYAFYNCTGFDGSLIIPNSSVVNIGYASFYNCSGFKGDLKIPDSTNNIGEFAFDGCSGFDGNLILGKNLKLISKQAFYRCSSITGNIIIPNRVSNIGLNAFYKNGAKKIFVGINSSDYSTNYRKDVIDNLPDDSTIIDVSYNIDISNTWIEDTNKTIGTISIKELKDNIESELVDFTGHHVSLYIPTLYKEENIEIIKDGVKYQLPNKIGENKYIFKDNGFYNINIVTDTDCVSNISFQVDNDLINTIEKDLLELESSKDSSKFRTLRDLINQLPESSLKDQLQERLNNIFPNIESETAKDSASAITDVYIKMSNTLSLSLNTSTITFDDVDSINNIERQNAVVMNIESSLPYQVVASLDSSLQNMNDNNTLEPSSLSIKSNTDDNYKVFNNIKDPVLIISNPNPDTANYHGIDLKLNTSLHSKAGRYKGTIKFEVIQE